jgi:hypothetical protein
MTKQQRYRAKTKSAMVALRSNPCTDCEGSFPYYVMEFDHVPERGPKLFTLSSSQHSLGMNSPRIIAEIKKCDLVCANCHKVRTWKRQQENPFVHTEESKAKISAARRLRPGIGRKV